MKHVLVLINQLSDSASADERDVLDQAEVVERTLTQMGYRVSRASMGADLEKTRRDIISSGADIVFNLVESVDNRADLTHIPPTLLSEMGIPFTGSGPEAMYLTSNKPEAKKLMRQKRIKTPEWYSADESWRANGNGVYIIKPLYEDASVGIDDNSIFRGNEPVRVVEYGLRHGDSFFIEEFIEGREFNISVIAGINGPEVLPPAEIKFRDFPAGKPAIVGYQAKWDETSFEYNNTPRSFDFPESDNGLLDSLREISASLWHIFGLKGYARVDYRVAKDGTPYVLEINANPCISPDSGFYAAVDRAGMSFSDALERIINDALK